MKCRPPKYNRCIHIGVPQAASAVGAGQRSFSLKTALADAGLAEKSG